MLHMKRALPYLIIVLTGMLVIAMIWLGYSGHVIK